MHRENHYNARRELVLFSRKNPRSLSNLVPEAMEKLMRDLWAMEDSPLRFNERELLQIMKSMSKHPTYLDKRLKVQFWLEYDRIQGTPGLKHPKMEMAYVLGHLIPKETFYQYYITDKWRLSYLIMPPKRYLDMMEETLCLTLERIQQILDKNEIKKHGFIDHKYIDKILEAFKILHGSLYGNRPMKNKEYDTTEDKEIESIDESVAQREGLEAEKAERLRKMEEYRKMIAEQNPSEPDLSQV